MFLKQVLFLLFIFLFFAEICFANLKVTNITNTSNKINVEFNDTLMLKNFLLVDNNLISPFYESKGNKYYFFYFLNRDLKNNIIKKATNKNDNIADTETDSIEYKINKCNIVKNPKTTLAFMSVIFNNNIEINCSILKGQYGLWIAWPSIKENGKWNKLFEIKDKKLKEKIETELLKYYKQKKNGTKF